MLGFPLGILSAAGAGGAVAGDYELIETQVLESAASSITFTSLATYASTYKHLQIRAVVRSSRTANLDGLAVRLNADSGSNYANHNLLGSGSSVTSGALTSTTRAQVAIIAAASATANGFGAVVIDLLDPYSTTKNKTLRTLGGGSTSSDPYIGLYSGLWMNTASVSSITLIQTEGANNLVAGSRFSLYGVRG